MTPQGYVVHRIHGRTRLRFPDCRGQAPFFRTLESELAALPSLAVQVNPATASVLLHHPETPAAALDANLRQTGLFDLVDGPMPHGHVLAPLRSMVTRLDRALGAATSGSADLRTVLFIVAAALATRQLARGQLLGPAAPMFWIAFELASRVAGSVKAPGEVAQSESP